MISAAQATEIAAGRPGVYLVTLTAGDIVVRAATRPADVPWSAGYALAYHAPARLEPLQVELDLLSLTGIGSYQSVRVEVASEDLDAAALSLAGHPLAGAEVEIARWWPGLDYTQREIVLRGRAQSPICSPASRALVFTATATPALTGGADAIDPERTVDDDYPARPVAAAARGQAVPVVLGAVRNIPGIKVGSSGGVDHLLLAGHWLPAGSISLYEDGSETATAGSPYAVASGYSDSGDKVAIVVGAGASTFSAAGKLTADLQYGGAPRVDGSGPTRTAADVLVWLLVRSEARIDWQRCRRALVYLATWPVGLYLDASAGALEVAQRRLLAPLPVVAVESGDGVWYGYGDLGLSDPVDELVEGQELLGPAPGTSLDWTSVEDCRTSFTAKWGYDHATGEPREIQAVTADTDPLCHLGRELVGDVVADPIDAETLWSGGAARRSALHLARRQTLPRGSARFVVDLEAATRLREGTVILVTWSPWGIDRRPVLVRAVYPAGDVTEVAVTVVPATTLRDGRL